MIINHSSKKIWDLWNINGISFDQNKTFSLRLLNFTGKILNLIKHDGIYEISTNLINRDDGNVSGVIGYVYLTVDYLYVSYQPTQNILYKLRFPDLNSSVFRFRSIETDAVVKFSEISFQLEIQETYGGF
jgi:hypothetical protein